MGNKAGRRGSKRGAGNPRSRQGGELLQVSRFGSGEKKECGNGAMAWTAARRGWREFERKERRGGAEVSQPLLMQCTQHRTWL